MNKTKFLTRLKFNGIQRGRKALNMISGEQFATRHFRNEAEAGTDMRLAIVSGIAAGNCPRCHCDPVSLSFLDHYTFPTPPLSKHFALSER